MGCPTLLRLVAAIAFVSLVSSVAPAQSYSADSVDAVSTDDGPHILWQSDSAALVFYFCDGGLDTQRHHVSDTLQFAGFCGDTAIVYSITRRTPDVTHAIHGGVSRVFAVSDIHGEYEMFVSLLQNSGVISEDLHWHWGDGHLVINGDVFDRGDRVTECLWLIYRLEQEASQHGGMVHFLLGNHDMMIMRGDNRYVHEKYTQGIARRGRVRHEDLYGPNMELGRWLRAKNTAVRINDVLFVHAGISPRLLERRLSLEALNDSVRASLDLPSSVVAFSDMPKLLFASSGPLWYRGYFEAREGRYEKASDEFLDTTLDYYSASSVVVGHSGVEHVASLYGGRVIALDVPFEDLGSLEGLLWENGKFHRITGGGERVPLEERAPE